MIIRESLGRDLLRLIVWYPLRWIVTVIPIRYGYAIFRMMGDFHYLVSRGKKHLITKNLQFAFKGKLNGTKLSVTVRNYFRNHYVNQLQIFLFPRLNKENIERFHCFEGLENLDDALRNGKGCILIHPHFGPTQLPLCALGIIGYPVMQLGLPTDEGLSFIGRKVAFRLRLKYESKIQGKIVSASSFLRPIMNWIKNNGVLMITGDGAGGGKYIGRFIPVEFFGEPVLFPIGAASLAMKTGSSLLPTFTILEKNNIYKTIIHKPIALPSNTTESQAINIATKKFVRIMEDYIYSSPYLWHFWDEWEKRACKNFHIPSQYDNKVTIGVHG